MIARAFYEGGSLGGPGDGSICVQLGRSHRLERNAQPRIELDGILLRGAQESCRAISRRKASSCDIRFVPSKTACSHSSSDTKGGLSNGLSVGFFAETSLSFEKSRWRFIGSGDIVSLLARCHSTGTFPAVPPRLYAVELKLLGRCAER
ncbi:MAG: hypothetical protein ABI330_03170 [Caldimonas sp.]